MGGKIMNSGLTLLLFPAVSLTGLLGCGRMLALLCAYVLSCSATLSYLILADIETNPTDIISFVALSNIIFVYLLTGFHHYLRTQIHQINSSAQKIISGNYKNINFATGGDEVASLQNSLAQVAKEFDRLVTRITQAVHEAHSAARSESSIAQRTADSAANQSDAVSGIAAAIEQMAVSVSNVSEQTKDTASLSQQTQKYSTQGEIIVGDTIHCINEISSSVTQAIQRVNSLSDSSNEISQIIDVIEDIASQTNLLALNAAIEAARAGEQVREFAVVSDEVRQLAIRTHDATEKVSAMIQTVQSEVGDITQSIEDINKEVAKSIDMGQQVNHNLEEINTGAAVTVEAMHTAASAMAEQNIVCDDIASNIDAINQFAVTSHQDAMETKDTALYLETLSHRVLSMLPKQP